MNGNDRKAHRSNCRGLLRRRRQAALGWCPALRDRASAMDCIDPNLRAAVAKKTWEELDLENLRGKVVTAASSGYQGGAAAGAGEELKRKVKRRARGVAAATP